MPTNHTNPMQGSPTHTEDPLIASRSTDTNKVLSHYTTAPSDGNPDAGDHGSLDDPALNPLFSLSGRGMMQSLWAQVEIAYTLTTGNHPELQHMRDDVTEGSSPLSVTQTPVGFAPS
ncbi:Hypothetical predicted protein [Pelobates cultripes]|uniref:Uncharacterized protein n=1 Tax=Pelobates cultripes TaxID=61616 RepID=A0AAD1RTL8_PELCU|nr:Hypothetical predicted protein [Pelobates cultripes]